MPTCGVYEIRNVLNGMVYIGSSKVIEARFWRHKWSLRRGTHHNQHLQRSWAKHGEMSFAFHVVETCTPDSRWECEEAHFQKYAIDQRYNSTTVSRGGTRVGQVNSPEHRKKISDARKGKPTWSKGGHNTWSAKATASMVSKYPNVVKADHLDGRVLCFLHPGEAAKSLGLARKVVSNILNGWANRTRDGWSFHYEPK